MVSDPIAGHVVERCLRVGNDALDQWHKAGFLVSVSTTRRCYRSADLDNLLAIGARNFKQTPTFADLVSGKVKLLTPREAAKLLKVDPSNACKLVAAGTLAAVKCKRALRYSEASVKELVALKRRFVTKQLVHILGVSRKTISNLKAQGRLIKEDARHFTNESVVALLKELLPPQQSPQEWIEDRLATTYPLLSPIDAAAGYDDRKRIRNLTREGKIHYIYHATQPARRQVLVSPDSLLSHIRSTQSALTKEDLALLFDVSVATIHSWDVNFKGWRTCPVHDHHDDDLYRDCMIFVLRRYLPSALTVAWYNRCLLYNIAPIRTREAASILGLQQVTVLHMVQAGHLTALRQPGGMLRYSRAAVLALKKKRDAKTEAVRSE